MSQDEPPGPGGLRIGLEVHVYLATRSKLHCGCPAGFLDAAPNANLCPVCAGHPGAKPMATNREAVGQALRVAEALDCTVADRLAMLRKHYFYPDLPQNYQRTSEPLATGGELRGVRVREVHLEEDPGAYDLHEGTVDLDRSGVPLLEIVTEPDLRSPAEARAFLDEVRLLVGALRAGRPGAGLKADANVSLAGGGRVEVKNLNSARNVERALAFEIRRHQALLDEGGEVPRETRHYDERFDETVRLRTKESVEDYRYLPDPDLPAVPITQELRDAYPLGEHPLEVRAEVAAQVGVDEADINVLLQDPDLLAAHRELARELPPTVVFNFLARDLVHELRYRDTDLAGSPATVEGLRALLAAREAGDVTQRVAIRLLRSWLDGAELDATLAREREHAEGADEGATRSACRDVLDAHPEAAADYRAGKTEALNFLMGQVMRKLRGRAPPEEVRGTLEALLGEDPGPR